MRLVRFCLTLLGCLFVLTAFASAQLRRPGLYETTSDINWVQSPFPEGMRMPPGANSPFGRQQSSYESCVTQEEIDRYGAILPQPHGECELTNVIRGASGLTATLVCNGRMQGQGTVEASWTPDGQGAAKVHFTGAIQFQGGSRPVEFISVYSAVYKGPDCGDVQPTPMPAE